MKPKKTPKPKDHGQDCKCDRCKANPASEPHTCPYQVEINDNSEFQCDCCDECRHECAMDI